MRTRRAVFPPGEGTVALVLLAKHQVGASSGVSLQASRRSLSAKSREASRPARAYAVASSGRGCQSRPSRQILILVPFLHIGSSIPASSCTRFQMPDRPVPQVGWTRDFVTGLAARHPLVDHYSQPRWVSSNQRVILASCRCSTMDSGGNIPTELSEKGRTEP